MKKLMNWMTNSFAPKVNQIGQNHWVVTLQSSIMTLLPLILVSSIITMIGILNDFFPNMIDLSPISSFSFGIISISISFLIPYFLMEKKGYDSKKIISGATAIGFFLMMIDPKFIEGGIIQFQFARLGAAGMFVGILAGFFVAIVMNIFNKFSLFKESTSLPDFVIVWFESLVPITIVLLTGWLLVFQLHFDMFNIITIALSPLSKLGQSYWGLLAFVFLNSFIYTFGISGWILDPIFLPIQLAGIQANADLVAAGKEAVNIHTGEVIYSGWISIGGNSATMTLVIMMIFLARSKSLKAIGKAVIIPSIFNINEPVFYGAPVVFNPLLMIPCWINSIVLTTITYFTLHFGLVTIPSKVFQMWYLPFPISTFLVSHDIRGLILFAINFIISGLIFYPFFKLYDKQQFESENINLEVA